MSTKNTLAQKIRTALRSKDERLLIETGFTHPSGNLTVEGRKAVVNLLFEEPEVRSRVIELANTVKTDICTDKK